MPNSPALKFLGILVLAATGCGNKSEQTVVSAAVSEGDQAAIEKLHHLEDAALTSYNADAFRDLIEDDVVALSEQGAPIVGAKAFVEAQRASLRYNPEYEWIHHQVQWKDLQIVGNLAHEWGIIESVTRNKSTGSMAARTWNMLRVLRRHNDGSWRVLRSCYASGPNTQ